MKELFVGANQVNVLKIRIISKSIYYKNIFKIEYAAKSQCQYALNFTVDC